MSSKQQYKEALGRDKRIMSDLRNQLIAKDNEIANLRKLNHQLKNQLSGLKPNYKLKKWWQFWK